MAPKLALTLAAVLTALVLACGGSKPPPGDATVVEPPAAQQAVQTSPPAAPARPAKERKLAVLDPGHGGAEVGSARNGVVEKESNLEMALRVENLLLAAGVDVVLTRRADARVAEPVAGYTAARVDIQARIDLANTVGADVFVSIHSNGSEDAGQRGVEVWFDSTRPFAARSLVLARLLLDHVLGELRAYGYAATNRGLYDGSCFRLRQGRCFTLFVLGEPRQTSREEVERRGGDPDALGFGDAAFTVSRGTTMPGALVELLLITNPADAAVLRSDAGRQAMARGVANAVLEFLALPEAPSN